MNMNKNTEVLNELTDNYDMLEADIAALKGKKRRTKL